MTRELLRAEVLKKLKTHGITAREDHLDLALALTLFMGGELELSLEDMARECPPPPEWYEEEWS